MNLPIHATDPTTALLTLVLAGGRLAPRRQLLLQSGSAQAALLAGPAQWRAAGLDRRQCQQLMQR